MRKIKKALIGFIFLICAIFLIWRVNLYFIVNSQLAAIHSAGFPASGAELNTWLPTAPDSENGAFPLLEAAKLIIELPNTRSNTITQVNFSNSTNIWPPALQPVVELFVRTNSAALAKAGEALRFTQFRFPIDWSFGPSTELPHLAHLKGLARIAAMAAILDAQKNDAPNWLQHLRIQLQIAQSLKDEPIVLSPLVRSSILFMASKTTEFGMDRLAFTDDDLKTLQALFEASTATNIVARAFIGERALTIPAFRLGRREIDAYSTEENDKPKPVRFEGKIYLPNYIHGFFERDLSFFLETMDKAISIGSLPPPQNLVLSNHFDAAFQTAHSRLYLLSSMTLGSYRLFALKQARTDAHVQTALAAIAIERFRLANHRLPDSLAELVPAFLPAEPIDPFTAKPLHYLKLTHGFTVYSVDSNGIDDHGREAPERRKPTDHATYDITFTVRK